MTAIIELYANNASSILENSITASSTTINIYPGDQTKFPTVTSGRTFFRLVLTSASSPNVVEEICYVTAVSGNSFTVIRGREGTTARSWSVNDLCWNAATAGSYYQFLQAYYGANSGAQNAYVVDTPNSASAYYTGMLVAFTTFQASTLSNPTLNVNNLGAVTITNCDGSVLLAGQIPEFSIVQCVYNSQGPRWELQSLNGVAITPPTIDNSTKIATTAFVKSAIAGAIGPANFNPSMNGIASPGVSSLISRGDHVHPTDTSRAPLVSPAFSGTPTAPTQAQTDSTTKLATTEFVKAAIGNATSLPTGTRLPFYQATAPVGWTKLLSVNDAALRIVSGSSGGTVTSGLGFSSVFRSQSLNVSGSIGVTTLTTDQIPSHSHIVSDPGHQHYFTADSNTNTFGTNDRTGQMAVLWKRMITESSLTGITINNTGGGAGHTHSLSIGGSLALNVTYADFIVCEKN